MKGRILVLAAVLLILPDPSRVSDAAPPSGFPWKMTFSDEFSRQDLDLQKWSLRCRSSLGRSEAGVLRDNVEIKGGVCRLLARKGDDGKPWTNANMFSRTFQQRYGYFEARIKTSATEAFTNVFALISRKHFYIDVVHAVPPHPHSTRAGVFGGGQGYPNESHGKALGLGKDFHLYGLLWTDSEVAWYVDGRQVRRVSHTALRHAARVQLVTWGNGLDGEVSEPMVVDYVRVYERLPRPPNWSDWHDGVQ